MKLGKLSETQVLTLLAAVALLAGTGCLILAFQHGSPPPWNVEESVVKTNTSIPSPVPSEGILPYVWKLHDLYETHGERLKLRKTPQSFVSAAFDLVWEGSRGGRVQISHDSQFNGSRIHLESRADVLNVSQLFVGENFWRVSRDGRLWSEALRFVVETEFLMSTVRVTSAGSEVIFQVSEKMKEYIVEFSTNERFPPESTFVFSRVDSRLPWDQKGFMRVRGVNSAGELTDYSPVFKFEL